MRLVAFEGLDGAGKRTLVEATAQRLREHGAGVAVVAFPRYAHTVFGRLIGDALNGRAGDLAASVYGLALLFAADRRDSLSYLNELDATNDWILADRYVSSNAAYGMARLSQEGSEAQRHFLEWITAIEIESFQLPRPTLQVYLDTPVELAQQRLRERAASKRRRRSVDRYESDVDLQAESAKAYSQLREVGHLSPWVAIAPLDPAGSPRPADDIAAEVVDALIPS